MKQLCVLIVEDSEDDALLVLRELRRGGYEASYARVDTAEAMAAALDTQGWDIVLSDHSMPGFSSIAALGLLQEKQIDLPFIIISGTIGEETAVAAMRAGAHDYLIKANLARLAPAVDRELREADERRKRREAEEALRESEKQLQRANRTLLMLKECHAALARANSEPELLKKICQIILGIDGTKMAWVGFAEDDEKKTVRPVAHAGDNDGFLKSAKITWADDVHGQGTVGRAIRTRKVNVCPDIRVDDRLAPWREQKLQRGYAATVALPLALGDQCMGALTIYSAHAGAFNAQEIDLLTRLAGDLSSGIISLRNRAEREKLQEELLRISEREKQLIAQELHDGLCQHFAGTAMMASLVHRRLAAQQNPEAEQLKQVCDLLNTGVHETRTLSHGLHPVKPGGDGLMEALTGLAQTVTNLFHIACTFQCDDSVIIDNQTAATHMFRIAQEAMNNAIRHGLARKVTLTLENTDGGVTLSIQDNGIGIPRNLPVSGGMGMQSMKHRAAAIGARLSIRRAGKRGTVVHCILPAARS